MADLSSKSYAKVVDLISEGEIAGLKNGQKSIYLNNTPLQNADGTYNFSNVTVDTRNGTKDQTYITLPGTDSAEISNVVSVGVEVQQSTPVTRTITSTVSDAARVTVNFPQLRTFNNDGSTGGATVNLKIAVQYNGGGFNDIINDTVSGRASDNYQKSYLINFTGSFPVDIRVTRVTADSTSSTLVDSFSWSSYTEITYAKPRYPYSSIVAMRFDAEQFSSFPDRAYLIRGIKVRIPSNATVDLTTYPGRITYSGVWDGTFKATREWTNDPCWCLFELLTNSRFGFGNYVTDAQLDKWAYYAASQYCNGLVDSGLRTSAGAVIYEPRFSCNVNIQQSTDAYQLINDMTSVFRAMPYWSTGTLTVSQDKPTTSSYLFNSSNVTEEGFSYSGSSQKTRSTVAVVGYFDMDMRDVSYEQVEDVAAIAKYGVQTKQIVAFACTSRGQANRLGRWLLYSEQYESEVIAFTASVDAGVIVRPGMVIDVSDPVRAGSRRGGRIKSGTTTAITVDNATGILLADSPTLSLVLPTGTVETRTVTGISGNVLTVGSAFSAAPNPNTVWIVQTTTLQTSQWRVISVQERDGCNYLINALSYNSSKYDYIESGKALQTRSVSILNQLPATPTNFTTSESLYSYQAVVRAQISVAWKPVAGISQYQLRWRKDYSNWTTVDCYGPDHALLNITPGFFEFQIYSVNALGKLSKFALTGSLTALGKTAPPSDVSNFSYAIDTDLGLLLTWSPVYDIDVAGYEIRRGSSWSTATLVTTVTASTYKVGYLDDGNYTYLIKAIDTSGSYSTNASSTTATFSSAPAPTVAATLNGSNVVINWTSVSGSLATKVYELRYGASYATASVLATIQGTTFTVRANWTGSRTFWVAAIDPRGRYGTAGSTSFTVNAPPQPSITSTITGTTLVMTWAAVKGTIETSYYEVRRGSTFATATVLGKTNSTSYRVTTNWVGAQTFWVVAYDVNDTIGTEASATITITAPSQPTITQQVIDNNVLLRWTDTTQTLPVVNYEVRRGSTWATASVIGLKQGGFTTVFETASGSYTYWIAGIDAAGNYGTPGSVTAQVNQPPDYVLKYNYDSTFSGTKTNTVVDTSGLVASVSSTETWQSHFTSRSWTTLQDQINAGFPYYGMPSATSGSYEETIDYGTVLAGTKITATMTSTNVAGSSVVTPTISVRKLSTDPWTDYPGLSQVYATQFQYFKIKYTFTSAGGDDLLLVTGLNYRLDSKLRNDSGNATANSADSGGTVVNFNIAFVDVDSISVTPLTTTAVIAVYDFTDVPNPTSFKVLLFNTSGTRVSGAFSWSARGV